VEFAVLAIPLFALLVGLLEFGSAFMKQQRLNFSCREAARLASLSGTTLADVQNAATYIMNSNYSNITTTTTTTGALTTGGSSSYNLSVQVFVDSTGNAGSGGWGSAVTSEATFQSATSVPLGSSIKVVLQVYYGTDASPVNWFLGSNFIMQTACVMSRTY
jgi:Flp pilus assembly protein TadG